MWGTVRARVVAILAACVAVVSPAAAQRLIVEVRDSASQAPIVAALVTATEQASGVQVFAMTNDVGRALLALGGDGVWTASARRIGIRPARAMPVPVAAGATVTVSISTTAAQFRLPAVRVVAAAPTCGIAPVGDGLPAVLWEQMTLALRASTLSRDDAERGSTLRVELFERTLDRAGRRVAERVLRSGQGTARPFFAADPDTLAARGFVQRDSVGALQYFAPDERVLLSDAFVRTHCFEAPAVAGDTSLAELRFRPIRGRTVPDVSGTAFIDVATGELRRIAFAFVNVQPFFDGQPPDAGGDVLLSQLMDKRWIVSGWTIRMPVFVVGMRRWERVLSGYREVGGSITPLRVISASRELAAEPRDSSAPESASGAPQRSAAYDVARRSGFVMRRQTGFGIFLDSAALASSQARTAARNALQLLQSIPDVTLVRVPDDAPGVPAEGDPDLAREWRAGADLPMMQMGGSNDERQVVCLAKLFADGKRASVAQLADVPARDVVALEFYRLPRQVPPDFRREGNRCGTALLWTVRAR